MKYIAVKIRNQRKRSEPPAPEPRRHRMRPQPEAVLTGNSHVAVTAGPLSNIPASAFCFFYGLTKALQIPSYSTVLGPSGAFSYAEGVVPHILQLQAKDRGFHLETLVSTPQVSNWATALHNEAEPKLCPLHHRTVCPCRQKACSNLKGAA